MTEQVIVVTHNDGYKFGLTGLASIKQNLQIICSTYAGTVPLERGMGVPSGIVDMPEPMARTMLASQIITAIEEYEPRAVVTSVTFKDTDPENPEELTPIIKFIEREVE